MARQKQPDPPEDDVPAWVMTFSDVITLLMTFFILLLTFASNQPETFDRMQTAMFGGGGASGIAGKVDGMDRDDLKVRERSRAGRIAPEGSKSPPIYSDPALATLDKGMSGLELEEYRVIGTTHHVKQPLGEIINDKGEITAQGKRQLALLGRQLRKRPLQTEFVVQSESELNKAIAIVDHLVLEQSIPSYKLGVGVGSHRIKPQQVLIVIANQGVERGSKD